MTQIDPIYAFDGRTLDLPPRDLASDSDEQIQSILHAGGWLARFDRNPSVTFVFGISLHPTHWICAARDKRNRFLLVAWFKSDHGAEDATRLTRAFVRVLGINASFPPKFFLHHAPSTNHD